jgi:hypothetical protein
VARTIAKKNTSFGSKREFVFVIRAKVGPTSATKNPKRLIVGFDLKEFFRGSLKIENFGRKQVNKIGGG